MKILQIDNNEFDKYVRTEPDSSIYHTARWNMFFNNPKSTYQYLVYADEADFYHAYALVEIRKKTVFGKLEAVIEYGYLLNFYDEKLLENFNSDLCAYLVEQKVKSITISPNILYETPYGNNDYLIKKLQSMGYVKNSDTYTYTRSLETIEVDEIPVKFAVEELEKSDLELIEKQFGYSISESFESFGNDINIMAVTVDFNATYTSIDEMLANDPENSELSNIKADVERLQAAWNKPVVEYVCYIGYDRCAYILYTDNMKNNITAEEILWNALAEKLNEIGYKAMYCSKPFKGSKQLKRIGEFAKEL